jgi:hypothetical protein
MTKAEIDEIVDAAIDAACASIQTAIGQTDGGFAAHYLSGADYQTLRNIFQRYAEAEIVNIQEQE